MEYIIEDGRELVVIVSALQFSNDESNERIRFFEKKGLPENHPVYSKERTEIEERKTILKRIENHIKNAIKQK